jgi:Protein of unknown function (DUF2752)
MKPAPCPTPPSARFCWALTGIVLGAVILLAVHGGIPLPCGFRCLTGLPCPGCGGTHAVHALAQGDWRGSLDWNPLILLGLVLGPILGRSRPGRLGLILVVGLIWLWQIGKGLD